MAHPLALAGQGYTRLQTPFPLLLKMQRRLPDDFVGPVYIWDLDKTYLNTRFSQLRHLLRIPFEMGVDKRAIAGTPELLHALRDGDDGRAQQPIFFVSASPHQLSTSVERKMLLDGIQCDGLVFKDASALVTSGRFGQLRFQVGYKLAALTTLLASFPIGAKLHLFGDDVEDDALIYCLFADLAAGRLVGEALQATLVHVGVAPQDATAIAQYTADLPRREAVAAIYIRLTRSPDGSTIADYPGQVVGWPTPVAVATLLRQRSVIGEMGYETVVAAADWSELVSGPGQVDANGLWTPACRRPLP